MQSQNLLNISVSMVCVVLSTKYELVFSLVAKVLSPSKNCFSLPHFLH